MRRIIGAWLATACLVAPALPENEELRLATTTSVENSGLLSHILPDFEKRCDCRVRTVVAGSGKALEFGRRGDVDALLTHAPEDEAAFMAEGYGGLRRMVMQNNFVIVGPPGDPAKLAEAGSVAAALARLEAGDGKFISRGDDSGTHKKEISIWRALDAEPAGAWYIEAGAGMGQALLMADELDAYTLSDRGTYLAFRDRISSRIVMEGRPLLRNPYSVTTVNPVRHPHVNFRLARRFATWLASPAVQARIGAFRYHGETLFFPATPK